MADEDLKQLQDLEKKELEILRKLEAELANVASSSVLPENVDDHSDAVSKDRISRIRAEEGRQGVASLILPPGNKTLLTEKVDKLLDDQSKEYEKLINYLTGEKAERVERIKKVDEMLAEEKRLTELVEAKCRELDIDVDNVHRDEEVSSETNASTINDKSSNGAVKALKEKLAKLTKLYDLRVTQLSDFLNKYFPAPSETRSDEIFDYGESREQAPLATFTQNLITAYLNDPNDCYLPIDLSIHEPNAELLLRTGIVIRNPENPSLVRLVRLDE